MTTTDVASADEIDAEGEHIPGEGDMWAFVIFESLVFTVYFCVYLFFRTQNERAFLDAQAALDLPLGIVDTIVLLTSSWVVARVIQHVRAGRYELARKLAIVTVVLGVLFFALKITEWVRLIHEGFTFTDGSSEFMQYFFFLTGIHGIHLLIGFVSLGILIYHLSTPKIRSNKTIETCATYWHTVDLFWILIFALLYIVR